MAEELDEEMIKPTIQGKTTVDIKELIAALREVYDPEIPVNIVDLGLIYDLTVRGAEVDVTMSLTAIGCPVAGEVMADVESHAMSVPNVEKCNVTLTFDPPWTMERMSELARWELGIN